MGYDTKNQKAVPISVIIRQLEMIEADIDNAESQEQAHFLVKIAMLVTIFTSASLRGHEGFYLDIAATRKHLPTGKDGIIPGKALTTKLMTEKEARNLPQVCIFTLGKFEGVTGERYHSIIVANESTSGLRLRFWLEKSMEVCHNKGRTSGYAFNNSDGSRPSPTEYNAIVWQYFQAIQEEEDNLVDPNIDVIRFGISRTYRKSSESMARAAGIPKDQVETMNREQKERCRSSIWRITTLMQNNWVC